MSYKKLELRNIFGKPVKIKDNKSIETVATLPTAGKPGVIYHNTTDNKYYVYNDTSWEEFGNGVEQISNLTGTGEEGVIYYNTTDGRYYIYSEIDSAFIQLTLKSDTEIPIINANAVNSNVKHTYVYGSGEQNDITVIFEGTDADFSSGATAETVIGDSDIVISAARDPNGFYLESNKFYKLGEINGDTLTSEYIFGIDETLIDTVNIPGGLRLYCVGDSQTVVKEYMGTFTVVLDTAESFNIILNSSIGITIPDDTPDFENGHTYEFNISASVFAVKDITYTES